MAKHFIKHSLKGSKIELAVCILHRKTPNKLFCVSWLHRCVRVYVRVCLWGIRYLPPAPWPWSVCMRKANSAIMMTGLSFSFPISVSSSPCLCACLELCPFLFLFLSLFFFRFCEEKGKKIVKAFQVSKGALSLITGNKRKMNFLKFIIVSLTLFFIWLHGFH